MKLLSNPGQHSVIAGTCSLVASIVFYIAAAKSPYPLMIWPGGLVAAALGVVGGGLGAFQLVRLRRKGEQAGRRWAIAGSVVSVLGVVGAVVLSIVLTILQAYDVAGWGSESRRKVLTAQISAEFEALGKQNSVAETRRICDRLVKYAEQRATGWSHDAFARATVHEYRAWCHWAQAENYIYDEKDVDAAERELMAGKREARAAHAEFRKTGKPRHLERMPPVISGIGELQKIIEDARAEVQKAARKRSGTKTKSAKRAKKTKEKASTSAAFEMTDVAGKSATAVGTVLGASNCDKMSDGRKRCSYRGGRVEVIFTRSGAATWITARPDGGSFHPSYVGAIWGPSMGAPTFSNSNVIRWENTRGFSSVQMLPKGNRDVDYVYWCIKPCR